MGFGSRVLFEDFSLVQNLECLLSGDASRASAEKCVVVPFDTIGTRRLPDFLEREGHGRGNRLDGNRQAFFGGFGVFGDRLTVFDSTLHCCPVYFSRYS